MKVIFPINPFQRNKFETKNKKRATTHRKILPHEKWKIVDVGESWTIPYDKKRLVYHAACTHGWRYDKKFKYKRNKNLVTITRVK